MWTLQKTSASILFLLVLFCATTHSRGNWDDIKQLLGACHRNDDNFNNCMKKVFNSLRPYFKEGVPEVGIPSFDPHFAQRVDQKRGSSNANYHLILRNVYEHGWTISKVTEFKADFDNDRIIYTQYFPEKALDGHYELEAYAVGSTLKRKGVWNITLYDYTQTTTITRGPYPDRDGYKPIDVSVKIDKIGNMKLHVSNILNGNNILENIIDAIINAAWRPGFAIIRPLINDLVSTAFTKIWGDTFRAFPFETLVPE